MGYLNNPLLFRIKKEAKSIRNNRSLHIIISFIGHSSVSFNFIFQSLIIISSIHRNGRPEQGRPFFCGIFRTGQTESDKSDMVRRVGHGQTGQKGPFFGKGCPFSRRAKREAADRNPQPQLQAVKKRELFTCRDVRSGELRCTGRILRPDRNTGWGRDKRTRCCGPTGRVLRRSAGRVCRQDERALSE